VQVDTGPITTATVGFVRRDAASKAENRFHGQWFQGSQLKVSVKGGQSSRGLGVDDEEFWRRELRDMQLQSRSLPERKMAAAGGRPTSVGTPASRGRQVRGRGPCVFNSSAADGQLRQGASDVSATSRGAVSKARQLRRSLPYVGQRAVRQVLVRNH